MTAQNREIDRLNAQLKVVYLQSLIAYKTDAWERRKVEEERMEVEKKKAIYLYIVVYSTTPQAATHQEDILHEKEAKHAELKNLTEQSVTSTDYSVHQSATVFAQLLTFFFYNLHPLLNPPLPLQLFLTNIHLLLVGYYLTLRDLIVFL